MDKKVLNAKHFDVLQDRKRVIIIGWKKNLKLKYPHFEENEPQYEILKGFALKAASASSHTIITFFQSFLAEYTASFVT